MPTTKKRRPSDIVRRGKQLFTRDGRYRIQARFALLWVAFRRCACEQSRLRWCFCNPIKLPGGVAEEAFSTLRELQKALRRHYKL